MYTQVICEQQTREAKFHCSMNWFALFATDLPVGRVQIRRNYESDDVSSEIGYSW